MELRIKEICREKGMTLQQIANILGISNVNLSNSLNRNPTLNRLKEVADVLGVEIWQLFKRKEDIQGIITYKGDIYSIDSYITLYNLTEIVKKENI